MSVCKWKSFALLLSTVTLFGCGPKINLEPENPTWDRTVCERCRMMVTDRQYSAQVVNPKNGKHFYFDDFGCAVNWLEEAKPEWAGEAIIYVTSAKDGTWLDVKKAVIAKPFITPMSYGYGVVAKADQVPEGKTVVTWEAAREDLMRLKLEKMKNRAHVHH